MRTIGRRVRKLRRSRGVSQRVLADLAGVSQAYISQVESGSRYVQRRSTLVSLAQALQVSVAELTGISEPGNPVKDQADAAVPAIREALIMREAGQSNGPPPQQVYGQAMSLHSAVDYGQLAPILPSLLRGCTGAELVHACYATVAALEDLGWTDLARDAAGLGVTAARELGDPAMIGVAEFARANCLPAETSSLAARVATAAAEELQEHIADPRARQAYGMLLLLLGLRTAVATGEPTAATDHLDQAAAEARSLGEPDGFGLARMAFGPTNVAVWRMTVGSELDDADQVLRVAAETDPRRLPTARRQAAYHIEHGRALAAVGGRDDEAISAFLQAEHIAPQLLRLEPTARDAAAAIRQRTPDAVMSRQLQRLSDALDLG